MTHQSDEVRRSLVRLAHRCQSQVRAPAIGRSSTLTTYQESHDRKKVLRRSEAEGEEILSSWLPFPTKVVVDYRVPLQTEPLGQLDLEALDQEISSSRSLDCLLPAV